MHRLISCCAPALLAALTACGTLSDGENPAQLATIQGQLTNAQAIDTPSSIRIAVLWQSAQERGGFTVAQEVEVEPVFPSKFKLALTAPPPAIAMLTPGRGDDDNAPAGPPESTPSSPSQGGSGPIPTDFDFDDGPRDLRLGFGFLVAYEDTNGNGKLDLVDEGATAFVDRILGANPELLVLYAEGNVKHPELADSHGNSMQLGYNLFKYRGCFENLLERADGGANPAACVPEAAWLPIGSLYDLPITSDPEFSELMCTETSSTPSEGSRGSYPGQKPDGTDPGPAGYPAAAEAACDADGKAYRFSECVTTELGTCRGSSTRCTSRYIGLPEGSVPAGWPCNL